MRKVTKCWVQRDGTKIRICDMPDSHLLNTIAMVKRYTTDIFHKELQAAIDFAVFITGEQASYAIEDYIRTMEEEGSADYFLPDIYESLCVSC